MAKLLATIQKVRYLAYPKCKTEVQYTVEGSNKIRRHTLLSRGYSFNKPIEEKLFWRNDELWHLYRSFACAFKSIGSGERSKTLYENITSRHDLKFEINYGKDGHLFLNPVRR